jgi:hypothetical protein
MLRGVMYVVKVSTSSIHKGRSCAGPHGQLVLVLWCARHLRKACAVKHTTQRSSLPCTRQSNDPITASNEETEV